MVENIGYTAMPVATASGGSATTADGGEAACVELVVGGLVCDADGLRIETVTGVVPKQLLGGRGPPRPPS